MDQFDITIVGAGIIGLATGMLLAQRHPTTKILILEKEEQIAQHQTGHNSGVIHSGIYYKPGSLKATNCTAGRTALIEFCDAHGIPYELCGKVIVATTAEEIPRLEELKRRGDANGVPGLEMIGPERLREIEPYAYGIKALFAPGTGIIDFTKVAHAYASELQRLGGQILTAHKVVAISVANGALRIHTSNREFTSKYLINCAGLHVDRTARMLGRQGDSTAGATPRIIPFRGEYYALVPERRYLVKGLIYPVPDPRFPFLGVHFTKRIDGSIEAGPNAVLAFAREGYRKGIWDREDLWEICSYKGFWLMAFKYWKMGLGEFYRSFSKRAFVTALQRLVPAIESTDLSPGGAGVRAQALSDAGALLDDFVLTRSGNSIHVLNAPSPGATASLAIAGTIADMAAQEFAVGC
jgi:(S)-2-hydroxyglutarate dehydrogenase